MPMKENNTNKHNYDKIITDRKTDNGKQYNKT